MWLATINVTINEDIARDENVGFFQPKVYMKLDDSGCFEVENLAKLQGKIS